ncbi:hypothetical protein [Aquirhabdus sp.]|uniref:hypothetical protein n=1 Tax=Aquirhabdus sp. TaxID=2824160 RepID=UPI00396CC9BC
MSKSTIFISKVAFRNLKKSAKSHLSDVSSSHLSEGIAAALGFKTYAALRAKFAGNATAEVNKPDNTQLIECLVRFGYSIPDDLIILPAFDESYSPFRNYPLRKFRGVRWKAWRNLMVSAINAGLEQRLFGLSPEENWWPRGESAHYQYQFLFDSNIPAIASVMASSGGALTFHVLLAPRNNEVNASECYGTTYGMAFAHGWLERTVGAWIMDGGEGFSCKRVIQARVAQAVIEPAGFSDQGSFIL